MATERPVSPPPAVRTPRDRDLQTRIRTEFREMPGLRLTLPQASRLFDVERTTCARTLARLVGAGLLAIDDGSFVRARR